MIGEKTIYVIPVERQSVQGRGKYSYVDPKGNLRPGKRNKARGVQVPIGFVPKKNSPGELGTGMDKFIENPYFEQEYEAVPLAIRPRDNWYSQYENLKNKKEITLQTYYEILDDVPAGHYTATRTQNVSMTQHTIEGLKVKSQTALEGFKVYLTEGVNTFNSKTSRGRLGIQAVENHPKVAASAADVNINTHDFYIGEKHEAAAVENVKRDKIKKAIRGLAVLQDDYESFDNYQLAVILGLVSSDTSQTLVRNNMDGFVMGAKKDRYGSQTDRCSRFSDLYDRFKENKDGVYITYLITQALNQGIMIVNAGNHHWRSKKGIDHLYNLGTNRKAIETMFLNEYNKYEPELENQANLYLDLYEELKARGVLLRDF